MVKKSSYKGFSEKHEQIHCFLLFFFGFPIDIFKRKLFLFPQWKLEAEKILTDQMASCSKTFQK